MIDEHGTIEGRRLVIVPEDWAVSRGVLPCPACRFGMGNFRTSDGQRTWIGWPYVLCRHCRTFSKAGDNGMLVPLTPEEIEALDPEIKQEHADGVKTAEQWSAEVAERVKRFGF